jgi:hypothetical protein
MESYLWFSAPPRLSHKRRLTIPTPVTYDTSKFHRQRITIVSPQQSGPTPSLIMPPTAMKFQDETKRFALKHLYPAAERPLCFQSPHFWQPIFPHKHIYEFPGFLTGPCEVYVFDDSDSDGFFLLWGAIAPFLELNVDPYTWWHSDECPKFCKLYPWKTVTGSEYAGSGHLKDSDDYFSLYAEFLSSLYPHGMKHAPSLSNASATSEIWLRDATCVRATVASVKFMKGRHVQLVVEAFKEQDRTSGPATQHAGARSEDGAGRADSPGRKDPSTLRRLFPRYRRDPRA